MWTLLHFISPCVPTAYHVLFFPSNLAVPPPAPPNTVAPKSPEPSLCSSFCSWQPSKCPQPSSQLSIPFAPQRSQNEKGREARYSTSPCLDCNPVPIVLRSETCPQCPQSALISPLSRPCLWPPLTSALCCSRVCPTPLLVFRLSWRSLE